MFAVPLNFILTHVRNPNEAMLLYEVGTIGAKLDTLVQFLVSQLQQEEVNITYKYKYYSDTAKCNTTIDLFVRLINFAWQVLDRKWRSLCNSVDPLVAGYVPSLGTISRPSYFHPSSLLFPPTCHRTKTNSNFSTNQSHSLPPTKHTHNESSCVCELSPNMQAVANSICGNE